MLLAPQFSYKNELVSLISRTFKKTSYYERIFIKKILNVFNLGANKKDLLHVTHCKISFLPFFSNSFISKLFQHVTSFRNMCCLFWFHMNMLTLFKRLLTKEQMSMQKAKMEKKSFLQLTCENNCDE